MNEYRWSAYRLHYKTFSNFKHTDSAVPQNGVWSSPLFDIYTYHFLLSLEEAQLTTYDDDMKSAASYSKRRSLNYWFNHIFKNLGTGNHQKVLIKATKLQQRFLLQTLMNVAQLCHLN